MAVIGHWKTLEEAQRLTQSQLLPNVVEEDIKRNPLLDKMPAAQASGTTIKWNREKVVMDGAVIGADIGDILTWTSDIEYDPQETQLSRQYVQRILDKFIPEVYGTINNYEAQALLEMKKGMVRKLNDLVVYGDYTYGTKEFDGIHAWAAVQYGTNLDINMAEAAMSLNKLRIVIDEMKGGMNFLYFPYEIGRRMDEAYQEAGFAGLATASAGNIGLITYGVNEAGKRIMFFDSIPIVRTDFLTAEQVNTGQGTSARAKYTSGTKQFSIFGIKFGDVFNGDNGLCLGFGNSEMVGQFYKLEVFDKLEDYDAGGFRLVSYITTLLGSKLSLGRIHDITDAAIVI